MNNDLYLIAINLTRRCNLACAHCYMDAETRLEGSEGEMDTDEVKGLLDEVASRSDETMVVLTGGEPLLRRDLEELVAHGSQLGLSMVVGTNGVLLNEARVKTLKAAGVMGMGISLDSLDPEHHDSFRGCSGSWEKTLAAMDQCRKQKLPFQVHFSVTEQNAHEVQSMIDFAQACGAHVLNIFFLVCTGRGESMSDITPARYEQVLKQLVESQEKTRDLIIRARCAPHFKRVAYEHDPESPLTRAQGYEGGGCLAGIHYCRITPEGAVTACPYIPEEDGAPQGWGSATGGTTARTQEVEQRMEQLPRTPGAASIRESGFWEIWDNSANFQQLRNPTLGGKCGQCEYQKLCGGCRARPLAMGGSIMDADPWCGYMPSGGPIIQPLIEQQNSTVAWSPEATQRLDRVPSFLRKMVRKRAEAYVQELGESLVTPEHMSTLAAKRFGDKFPGKRPGNIPHASAKEISSSGLAWTSEAKNYLQELPGFLREGVFAVAEDVARNEGRLEVNIKLLHRLEEEDDGTRKLSWETGAEALLEVLLADREPQVRMFVKPSMEAAAEREAKRRDANSVSSEDVQRVIETDMAGVEWQPDALARVESAPEFVRAGIKKAAEFSARREGLERITSEDLTLFRNRAMMKAVRRMKGFGLKELNFDAFDIAKKRVPRLQENEQAELRFSEIRNYVESKQAPDGSGLGLLDRELLEKMKAELKS